MRNGDVHFVPLLGVGSHSHPRQGGCLLELVSTLPSGRWTAYPDTVDPVLGMLARAVNDRTSSAERPALAPLIPWLAGLPDTDEREIRAALVATAAAAALPLATPDLAHQLSADAATACGPAETTGWRGWLGHRARYRAAVRVMRLAVDTLAATSGDDALRSLLAEAINQLRLLHALPALPQLNGPAQACRVAVPVESQMLAPDGGDSTYFHCTALIEFWPAWLREPWLGATAPQTAGHGL